jgi:quercetin dioxygenase-like cupin family protein
MKKVVMKTISVVALVAIIVGCSSEEQPGTRRVDLQRHDLSMKGREVVQVRVEFDPGYVAPKHWHHGEEIIYILEGTLEYYVEGRPATIYRPGDVLIVPAKTIHSVKNVGSGNGAELATYIVEKGPPLLELDRPASAE